MENARGRERRKYLLLFPNTQMLEDIVGINSYSKYRLLKDFTKIVQTILHVKRYHKTICNCSTSKNILEYEKCIHRMFKHQNVARCFPNVFKKCST